MKVTSGGPRPAGKPPVQQIRNSDTPTEPQRFAQMLYGGKVAGTEHRDAGPGRVSKPASTSKPEPSLVNLLGRSVVDALDSEKRLDRLYRRVRRHGIADVEDVIELQVATYRYSQQVDLLSKVVDKTTSALKEVLRTRL